MSDATHSKTKSQAQKQFFYACGKRKTAVARVRLIPNGTGKITVNEKDLKVFCQDAVSIGSVKSPLKLTDTLNSFDVVAHVDGGGFRAQSEALRHGIARALVEYSEMLRPQLKRLKLLTRDSRIKERKKYGLKRARRAPQFSKR